MTLFLGYATEHLGKSPMAVQLIDITPELVLKFQAHLERERHNSVRSRNLRLTALRSFLKFAGRRDVTALHAVEPVMAVPMQRFERPLLGHLTRPEMIAVLGRPATTARYPHQASQRWCSSSSPSTWSRRARSVHRQWPATATR